MFGTKYTLNLLIYSFLLYVLKEAIKINEFMITEYLNKENIKIVNKYFPSKKDFNIKDVNEHINLIINIHKILMKCKFNGLSRIESKIGREIEGYKVQLKRIKRDYNNLIMKSDKNELDKFLIFEGKNMISQANRALDNIYDDNYLSIINRSMNRKEICLGRVDCGNLREQKGVFEIGSLKGISYNLIEEDVYKYIKRIKKRNSFIDESEVIDSFVRASHLSYSSINYLKRLCNYPKDFFKSWECYRKLKNGKTYEDEEYFLEFKKIMEYEFKS